MRRRAGLVAAAPIAALIGISAAGRTCPTDDLTSLQAAAPATVDAAAAFDALKRLVAFGPRPSGSGALLEARAYITRQLGAYGLTVQEQPFVAETPRGRVAMMNLIVTLKGDRPERIVIAGHYDTKIEDGFTFVGANDGASSAALLIELAHAVAKQPRTLSYEFIWFDGEEAVCDRWDECGSAESPDHTYGSRFYLQQAQAAHATSSIHAMILVDMIGAKPLRILREQGSTPWVTDAIWNAARATGQSAVFADAGASVTDDHTAWIAAGIPAADVIDLMDYPEWHTAEDDLDHVSAESLGIAGNVILAALPAIERHR